LEQHQAAIKIIRTVEESASTGILQARTIASATRVLKTASLSSDENEVIKAVLAAAHGLACHAAQITVLTLQRLATFRTLRFALLPRRDFDHILRQAKEGNWTETTPVSQALFGPLWDREPPSWWKDSNDTLLDKDTGPSPI
jgi:hypothetical protein